MSDAIPLAARLAHQDPALAANALSSLKTPQVVVFLNQLPAEDRPAVVGHLPSAMMRAFLSTLDASQAADLLNQVGYPYKTRAARTFPAEELRRVLSHLPRRTARQIRRDVDFPPDSVGAWMETAYSPLEMHLSVAETFTRLRSKRRKIDPVLLVVNPEQQYRGIVDAGTLLGAPPRQSVIRLANRSLYPLSPAMRMEHVSGHPGWSQYPALPVVGAKGVLLGLLRLARLKEARGSGEEDGHGESMGLLHHLLEAGVVSVAGLSQTLWPSKPDGPPREGNRS